MQAITAPSDFAAVAPVTVDSPHQPAAVGTVHELVPVTVAATMVGTRRVILTVIAPDAVKVSEIFDTGERSERTVFNLSGARELTHSYLRQGFVWSKPNLPS